MSKKRAITVAFIMTSLLASAGLVATLFLYGGQ